MNEATAKAATEARELVVETAFDGQEIARLETVGSSGIEALLATAHGLHSDRDKWIPQPERIEILHRAAAIMKSRADKLATDAAREGGKPLVDSQVEVARAIDGIENCIEVLRTEQGRVIPMNVNAASAGRVAFTRKEPIGVVAAVSAFNHPLNMGVHQVAPAVACGCPVLIKPASSTPMSVITFLGILEEAGLPPGWAQLALTENSSVATEMVTDERVSFFSFIGSARVGWMLRSKLAPGARCGLEHGGAAPVIVAKDADIDGAVPILTKGGFYHGGQVCVSVQRVFAEKSVAERLAKKLADAAQELVVGNPTDAKTEVGPLISTREVDRVREWVEAAVAGGAKLLSGGEQLSPTTYAPTVLLDPPDDAEVSQKEVFGPVVCVYSCDSIDSGIARANGVPFSFQSAVFTQSIETALRVYARINGSAVMINDHTAFRVDWMPFAGLGVSGHGVGGMPGTMHEMQIEKMMVLRSNELL